MIITRKVINKNIKFYDYDILSFELFEYDFDYLSKCIDLYKSFLLSNGVEPKKNVIIGEDLGIWQTAALFACYELGLTVIVFDVFGKMSLATSKQKLESFCNLVKNFVSPIDYFLVPYNQIPIEEKKNYKYYHTKQHTKKTLVRYFDHEDISEVKNNDIILAQKDFILTQSLSSGTCGKRKIIKHTHEFLYSLMCRNSRQFYGKYLNTRSLNHGSSIFCYFMPAIVCKNVTDFYLVNRFPATNNEEDFDKKILNVIEFCDNIGGVDHISTCDASVCELMFKQIKSNFFSRTNIHILSYIKSEWVDNYYKTGVIGDIISNFGSNETTGPVFLNKASDKNFSEISYKKNDDYFDTKTVDNGLEVFMPVYNKTIILKDKFILENDRYNHQGRIDLLRINDLQINSKQYSSISNEYFHSELVFDQIKSEIYLVIWEQINYSEELKIKIDQLNDEILNISEGKHKITKYSILVYEEYFGSIKIDMEQLRDYFRNPNENYKKLN